MSVPRLVTLAALCAAALICAAPASAKAPARFLGTVWDGDAVTAPDSAQDSQWGLMASSGVRTVRGTFSWADAQPVAGRPFDFSRSDRMVHLAAAHGLDLLPVVQYVPAWARAYRSRPTSPARREADYTAYLTAL